PRPFCSSLAARRMGCIECKLLNPRPADPSVRHYWHVRGVCLDSKDGIEKRPPGIIYVFNGKLCYQPRHCVCSKEKGSIEAELAHITSIFSSHQFSSDVAPSQVITATVVDVNASLNGQQVHFGVITNKADEVCNELNDIIRKHRQKPKIMQFNSIDVDGVEIDLP
ncbi:hypothetical protein PENTCL1PPCAC_28551, partial [Pristionchus entomophagus]